MNIVFINLPINPMHFSLWLKRKEYRLKKKLSERNIDYLSFKSLDRMEKTDKSLKKGQIN